MSTSTIMLKIDGVEVTVPEGTMILKAARDNGVLIPTLCNLEGLNPYGGCRLCLVEITGSPKLFPACITPVSSGMEVTTHSGRLKEYRKMAVQMLLAERTHICSVCIANDHCELQSLANQLGVDHVMFGTDMPLGPGQQWTERAVDRACETLGLSQEDKEKIYLDNAEGLLRLNL
jgi:bidirectional [NiFe] hydrogenase diaphorase subunit